MASVVLCPTMDQWVTDQWRTRKTEGLATWAVVPLFGSLGGQMLPFPSITPCLTSGHFWLHLRCPSAHLYDLQHLGLGRGRISEAVLLQKRTDGVHVPGNPTQKVHVGLKRVINELIQILRWGAVETHNAERKEERTPHSDCFSRK